MRWSEKSEILDRYQSTSQKIYGYGAMVAYGAALGCSRSPKPRTEMGSMPSRRAINCDVAQRQSRELLTPRSVISKFPITANK